VSSVIASPLAAERDSLIANLSQMFHVNFA